MKKILVPCDFSDQAQEAYTTAMDWASKTNGEVIALFVIFIPPLYDDSFGGETMIFNPQFLTRMEQEANEKFATMKRNANLPSVQSRLEITYGDVVFAIRNFSEANDIDLIVMGTSGSSGLAELFIGSTTEKVVRFSSVPILVVRKSVRVSSLKNILVPTLMNLDETNFIKRLKDLQHFLGANLHFLFVNSPGCFLRDLDARRMFDEFAQQYKLENCDFHFRNYRNEEEGILDFFQSGKMDLIAMATHARKGLAHIFNGSLTEDLVNHISGPIWTYTMKKS
jgi:nucleotide-binding universal stress UspA family protein